MNNRNCPSIQSFINPPDLFSRSWQRNMYESKEKETIFCVLRDLFTKVKQGLDSEWIDSQTIIYLQQTKR